MSASAGNTNISIQVFYIIFQIIFRTWFHHINQEIPRHLGQYRLSSPVYLYLFSSDVNIAGLKGATITPPPVWNEYQSPDESILTASKTQETTNTMEMKEFNLCAKVRCRPGIRHRYPSSSGTIQPAPQSLCAFTHFNYCYINLSPFFPLLQRLHVIPWWVALKDTLGNTLINIHLVNIYLVSIHLVSVHSVVFFFFLRWDLQWSKD